MTTDQAPLLDEEFPFTRRRRKTDRDALLTEIVTTVWDSILGLAVAVRDHDDAHADEPTVTGTVHIDGAWTGTVTLTGARTLAETCGRRMFGERETLNVEGIRDAWGELSNMVAGNLKALVPPVSRLSLPEVRDTTGFEHPHPHERVLNDLTFASVGRRIRVVVAERITG